MTLGSNEEARKVLCQIVARYGQDICSEPNRVRGLLKDLCNDSQREVFLLDAASRSGVVEELIGKVGKTSEPPTTLISRLAARLANNTGLEKEYARWAIESWALALGIVQEPLSSALATPISSATTPSQIHTVPSSIVRARQLTPKASLTLGYEFVEIPSGRFRMGSPSSEPGRIDAEGPQHTVTISRSFLLGATEVTQGQWRAVMGNSPSHFSSCGDDCPVEKVSWDDVVDFCNRLSDLDGLSRCYSGSGNNITWNRGCTGYRLPTEAEWEYAARAGTQTALYTGPLTIRGNNNGPELDAIAWYGGNSGVTYSGGYDCSGWPEKQYSSSKCGTHPVGRKQPNGWGLYDMHGNVWEWVWDWKADYPSGSVTDPVGPSGGSYRVLRGGSFLRYARFCRSARRGWGHHTGCGDDLGFRLARSLP